MADDGRTTQRDVGSDLDPSQAVLAHSFFQVLRRIECEHREMPRLGEALDPALEPVRLGQSPSLAFQGTSIVSAQAADAGRPERISVSFFGLFGPNGPLPLHLSDYAYQRLLQRDPTLARFADLFHHRLLCLFYRAWAQAQPTLSGDRPQQDHFARYFRALLGQYESDCDSAALDRSTQRTATHYLSRTRHPEGLCKALSELLDVPVRVEEFVAEWLPIPDEYRWRLPAVARGGALVIGELGTSTRIGTEVLERRFKFRIEFGPMPRERYERFLPGGDLMPQVVRAVQRYAGYELSWDVRLLLDEPHVQPVVLGLSGRLGQTSYLGAASGERAQPMEPLVLDPLAQVS